MLTTNIHEVIDALKQSNIVAIPTETVYGLAGNAYDEQAIKKIFALKNRPLDHPLILHTALNHDLNQWVTNLTEAAKILIKAFWPGPLTLVFKRKPNALSSLVSGGQDTLAIRCPHHPLTTPLLTELAFPLVAPSANPFGKISPTTALHVQQGFNDENLLILDGGRCAIGIESTIIDVSNPAGYQILRHGLIHEQAFKDLLPGMALQEPSNIRVSGSLKTHYQPQKPLYCFHNIQDLQQFCTDHGNVYVLAFNKDQDFAPYPGFQLSHNPQHFAYQLYYELRRADESDCPLIALELPPAQEEWQGVRERLLKAGIWY